MSDETPIPTPPDGQPSKPAGYGGRAQAGRFGAGNKFGRGNPLNRKVQKLRAALLRAVKAEDFEEAARKLIEQAKAGDRQAFSELADRILGRPAQADVIERMETLEGLVERLLNEKGTHNV